MTSPLWAQVSDLPADLREEPNALKFLEYATFVVWSLSGRRYAPTQTLIEAYDTRDTFRKRGDVYPMFHNGRPYNVYDCESCVCSGCGIMHRTRLRQAPVQHILDVWLDGKFLNRKQYVLLDYSVLGLKTDEACGAECIVVRYAYGTGIPPGGTLAVARLAEELLRASLGQDCSLPERVTSVSRQGMTWALLDPQEFLVDGRTGVYEVDLLLVALNPAKALARPKVFTPDSRRAEIQDIEPPPMSLILEDNDQAFVAGLPATLITRNPLVMSALLVASVAEVPPATVTTRLAGSTSPLDGYWVLSNDKQSASFGLSEYTTAAIPDGTKYLVELNGDFVFSGLLRTFP